MHMKSFVFVFLLLLSTFTYSFASDLRYYFKYKDSVSSVLKQYQKLVKECKSQNKDECVDIETHGRNFLIQKTTAYKEYSSSIESDFKTLFPNALKEEAYTELAQHNDAVLNARFLAGYADNSKLPEVEQTINTLLKKNVPLLTLMSTTYHLNKNQELHKDLTTIYIGLEKETKLAEDSGLDVVVAKRHIKDAKKSLDQASLLLEKNEKLLDKKNLSEIPPQVPKNVSDTYKVLIAADDSMLKATQVLLTFAERAYW